MRIGVPKETQANEKRVATTPEVVVSLQKLGFDVVLETGAGEPAHFSDSAYREAGATIAENAHALWESADIILKVNPPTPDEVTLLNANKTLIGFISPAQNKTLLKQLADQQTTVLAIDSIPRISRAQKMDALSSMANIAGYRAVIEAAEHFGRFFTGQITAAGNVPPAKVMVIGAGVAGLAAIGTAKSLGAIVRAFDTRPEVKEQIASMDAEFLEVDIQEDGGGAGGYAKQMSAAFIEAEMQLFAAQAKEVDIIITTALIPGKPAPKLITKAMVESMKDGSVIVDLAAQQGGNCEATVADKAVSVHGVTIIGYTDLPSRLPTQSSQLYSANLRHLIADLCPEKNGTITINMDDEVMRSATVVKDGAIISPPPPPKPKTTPKPATAVKTEPDKAKARLPAPLKRYLPMIVGGLMLYGLGAVAPPTFVQHFTVFVLACFIGYMVIWNVTPSLHTPLMSVTNAISSIIIIGALLQISSNIPLIQWIAIVAALITSINIAGGFAVTQRMLKMFRK